MTANGSESCHASVLVAPTRIDLSRRIRFTLGVGDDLIGLVLAPNDLFHAPPPRGGAVP
jgi:hypothetical protein